MPIKSSSIRKACVRYLGNSSLNRKYEKLPVGYLTCKLAYIKWLIPRPGLVQIPFHKGHLKRINDLWLHASQLRSMKIPREKLPKKDRCL